MINLIDDDACVWERKPRETLAACSQLSGYKHDGVWQAMDTLRGKNHLEELGASGKAPWKKVR